MHKEELHHDTGREDDSIRQQADREQEISDQIAAQETRLAEREADRNTEREASEKTALLRAQETEEDAKALAVCEANVREATYELCIRATYVDDGSELLLDHPMFLPAALDNQRMRIPLLEQKHTVLLQPSRKLAYQRSKVKSAIARNKRSNLVKL